MTQETITKYAIVDLEATSASTTGTIIQVGIVIIEDKEIVATYATDVNPHEPLSEHIISLTGITDEQLAKAPDFSQVAGEIFDLIQDCPFVAHNVKFDANLLAEHLFMEGYELRTPRIDTVELAQVFYPQFEKYSLGELAKLLALDLTAAHTAISDAYATAQLFIHLSKKIEGLPKELLEQLLTFSDNLSYETGSVIATALAKAPLLSQCSLEEVGGIILKKASLPAPPRHLSTDWEINCDLMGLDYRQKQAQFASLLTEGYAQSEAIFLEAPAGIGKTYAYLLALLPIIKERQLILSVPTKLLQDQIMAKEADALARVFHITSHSIKGYRNYIKLDAFYDSLHHQQDNHLVNRYKMQLLVWLTETETGDLDEIKQKQRFEAYFETIRHDGHLSEMSLFKAVDFWQKAYRMAKNSQIVVTNHAYLLERIQDDTDFVADKVLVCDEAQYLLQAIERFSRQQLNLSQLRPLLIKALEGALSLLEKRLVESCLFDTTELIKLATSDSRGQMTVSLERMERMSQTAKELVAYPSWTILKWLENKQLTNYWLETVSVGDGCEVILEASRERFLSLASLIPESTKLYFSSATLRISPKVNLATLLGFDSHYFAMIPQDKSPNQQIWLVDDIPEVNQLSDKHLADLIAQKIKALAICGAPLLVLFTAKKLMYLVSDLLDESEIGHLTQDKNGTAAQVKRRFEQGIQTILLGTGAFWEGADFSHFDEIVTLITRLPFANPKDPFLQKISHHLQEEGKNPFSDYVLPQAILRLKQAIGRTNRRDGQRSAVLLLDKRPVTRTYGDIIMQHLEREYGLSQGKFTQCLAELTDFLYNKQE